MKITSFKQDNDLVASGIRPNYIVISDQVGCPFISSEMAIKWHCMVGEQGVETRILDLTEYDWELNPFGFKVQDISTLEAIGTVNIDLMTRNDLILN